MRHILLEEWSFHLGDEPDAWTKGFDDSTWHRVRAPHDWSVEQPFDPACSSGTGYLPGGLGWYRTHCSLTQLLPDHATPTKTSQTDPDQAHLCLTLPTHVRLVFAGIYKRAQVWVNGYHLGSRPSGYAEFWFDLSEIIAYSRDDDLVIAVRVDHTDSADSRWYNGAGLTRPVELQVHPLVHLAPHGTTVTTVTADEHLAVVRLSQAVTNKLDQSVRVRLNHEWQPLTPGARHHSQIDGEVPPGQTLTLEQTIQMTQPLLWDDERPNLYRLTTSLTYQTDVAQPTQATYHTLVGLRHSHFDANQGFFVNGRRRTLRGVCLHEDAGCLGVAVPTPVWWRRLLSLKQMGCNAIRMTHNPHSPDLYTLCDLLGFYVVDEAFDEWENPKNKWWQGHNVYPPKHQGYAHDFPAWHQADLAAMVQTHQLHPSIIAWSIGNEIDYPNDPYASPLFTTMTGNNDATKPAAERAYDPARPDIRRATTIAQQLTGHVHRLDPTRPVTLAAAFPELSSRTGLLDSVDLIGLNYKEPLYQDLHQSFPDQPLLGLENDHSWPNWRMVSDHDWVAGQFLWTGVDYLGEAPGWPIHGSGAGLLSLAGFAKPAWHLRRSWWSDQPMIRLFTRTYNGPTATASLSQRPVSRAWPPPVGADETPEPDLAVAPRQPEGTEPAPTELPVEILCFSNCDTVWLSGADQRIPLTFDDHHGYWTTVVTAQDTPLVVEGSKDGHLVSDRLDRSGPPCQIEAHVWQAHRHQRQLYETVFPKPNIIQIECRGLDQSGHTCGEEITITATVDGGRLLGVENGDLGDTTAYTSPTRQTEQGRLVVFVEPHGPTTIRLSCPGLPDTLIFWPLPDSQ